MATQTVVGLKGGDDSQPTFVALGGGSGGSSPNGTSTHMNNVPSQSREEFITFDFIVNLSMDKLAATYGVDDDDEKQTVNDNDEGPETVKIAMKECLDCEVDQIRDLVLKEIITGERSRVRGKIFTDDWELPMLHKRFKKIIPDHLLSSSIKRVCRLPDRPQISRFSYKTSAELKEKRKMTDDLRSEKMTATKIVVTKPLMTTSGGSNEDGDRDEPSDWQRQKTPMKKRAGKEPGSTSLQSTASQDGDGDEVEGAIQRRRRREIEQNQSNYCICKRCVVL